MPVIGYLSGWSAGDAPEYLNCFRQGLAENGYPEGRNVAIEYRYAAGRFEEVAKLSGHCHCDTKHNSVGNHREGSDTNHSDSLFHSDLIRLRSASFKASIILAATSQASPLCKPP
jgi:hypothetical protein